MKIATFNINNINNRLDNLLAWLSSAKPDVVCLQELKAETRALPAAAIESAGYHAVWQGQRTWNGVAILSKKEPILIRRALPGDKSDDQARYIEAAVSGIIIGCIYLPNGNRQPGPKFDYKLAWFDRLIHHARALDREGAPVVLAGDFTWWPDLSIDIYPTQSWAKHPGERIYTYWDYKRQRWERNGELRLDHILLNRPLHGRLKSAGIDRWVRAEEGASDHAPAWIDLKGSVRRA